MPPRFKESTGPEAKIQHALINLLKVKDWFVLSTHGNAFQVGLPDLFICHRRYGHRWIDVKNPSGYKFTPAQLDIWPLLCAHGSGVWILTAATEHEYEKLFQPCNWYTFTLAWRQEKGWNDYKEPTNG